MPVSVSPPRVRGPYRNSYLVRHGKGWKYHRSVPTCFRKAVGKTAWIKVLGNVSREEAERRAAALNLEVVRELSALECLKPEQRAEIEAAGGVNGWRKRVSKATDDDANAASYLRLFAELDLLEPDEDEPDDMQAAHLLAVKQAERELKAIEARKAHAAQIERALAAEAPREPNLFALVALHEKVSPPRSYKTTEKARLYVRRFVEAVGDLAPRAVTREHVIKFRDELEAKDFKSANIGQHLAKLHTLFNCALSEGVVTSNPAHGVKARRQPGDKHATGKQGFSPDQARRIFKALNGESADFQWIIRLLAYHGCRGSEVCQLKCEDVTTLHGIPVLRIHDRHGSVKNKHSVRDIPIHPMCKGIIAHAASVAEKHGTDSWLFATLTPSKQGRGHNWQNYANAKFLRTKLGITDDRLTMHSFRHTWRTLAREMDMPEAFSRAILGHTMGTGEHAKYGARPTLKGQAEWLAKVDPLAS